MLGVLQQKWVDALRSGKYAQCTGRLKSLDNHYCCLGVAEELLGPFEATIVDNGFATYYYYDGEGATLTSTTFKMLAMTCDGMAKLINKNDFGATFEEIADYIEANAEEIFMEPA